MASVHRAARYIDVTVWRYVVLVFTSGDESLAVPHADMEVASRSPRWKKRLSGILLNITYLAYHSTSRQALLCMPDNSSVYAADVFSEMTIK